MSGANRPIAFDFTHIVTRSDVVALTGIDQVDIAYARYLDSHHRIFCGVHYGKDLPHRLSPERISETLKRVEAKRTVAAPSLAWPALRAWIRGEAVDIPPAPQSQARPPWRDVAHKWRRRVTRDGAFDLPKGTIYLNVAQHAFEHPRYFRWMDERLDVLPVFVVHDLLPLELPEFFRAGYEARFQVRLATILRHAQAIVTTSQVVRSRIEAEYDRYGRRRVPIHVQPLASPLEADVAQARDGELKRHPYFVVVATIEPRKNHLMLLHVWRQLAAEMADPPKLVVVGGPGWDYGQTLAVLERSTALKRCVRHVSGLPGRDLSTLIANARALLMPSFAEGYGLPIVEALSLGTPVIASDIPTFHEVSQGCATFASPIAGDAWRSHILAHAQDDFEPPAASAFIAPNWDGYFAGVEAFLQGL